MKGLSVAVPQNGLSSSGGLGWIFSGLGKIFWKALAEKNGQQQPACVDLQVQVTKANKLQIIY